MSGQIISRSRSSRPAPAPAANPFPGKGTTLKGPVSVGLESFDKMPFKTKVDMLVRLEPRAFATIFNQNTTAAMLIGLAITNSVVAASANPAQQALFEKPTIQYLMAPEEAKSLLRAVQNGKQFLNAPASETFASYLPKVHVQDSFLASA